MIIKVPLFLINFYKINTLPYQTFLKPTENDGALLLAAKFTSVSHLIENHELNVDQIISILNTIVTTKYSDRISQYFKLLKKTINVLLKSKKISTFESLEYMLNPIDIVYTIHSVIPVNYLLLIC